MKNLYKLIALIIILCLVCTGCKGKQTADTSTHTGSKADMPVSEGGTMTETSDKTEAKGAASDALMPTAKPGAAETTTESPATEPVKPEADYGVSEDAVVVMEGITEGFTLTEGFSVVPDSDLLVDDSKLIDEPVTTDEPILIDDPVIEPPVVFDEPEIIEEEYIYIEPHAGLLTAAEWNDNKNIDFLRQLLANGMQDNYEAYFTGWGINPMSRLAVRVTGTDAVCGANVTVFDSNQNALWKAVTDNNGMAYLFYDMFGKGRAIPAFIKVEDGSFEKVYELSSEELMSDDIIEISLDNYANSKTKSLDLMFVVDTTGSMGDELEYLKVELEDIIGRTRQQNGNIGINLSVNFYRDEGDLYVVRPYDFTDDTDTCLREIRKEYAAGGGDYEEAVEQALENAVNGHEWTSETTRLMFLVLDAPPHNTETVIEQLTSTISDAAAEGIRIIPIASSGVDKNTEFFLRAIAMATGGTYTFLTNDSGIGYSHIEPTVGDYEVEQLNNMIVRIIGEYLK